MHAYDDIYMYTMMNQMITKNINSRVRQTQVHMHQTFPQRPVDSL